MEYNDYGVDEFMLDLEVAGVEGVTGMTWEELYPNPTVFIDMDGTLADTYSVPEWNKYLEEYNPDLFLKASPADRESVLEYISKLGSNWVVVTMLPEPMAHPKYNEKYYDKVKENKITWLNTHFPEIEEIIFVEYGETKNSVLNPGINYLIDDSNRHLSEWNGRAIKSPWSKSLDEALRELGIEGREEIR